MMREEFEQRTGPPALTRQAHKTKGGNEMAYPNLAAEMTRRSITAKDIASAIGRSPDTVNNWLRGKGNFPIDKAFKVQEAFFPTYTITYLFSSKPITPDLME